MIELLQRPPRWALFLAAALFVIFVTLSNSHARSYVDGVQMRKCDSAANVKDPQLNKYANYDGLEDFLRADDCNMSSLDIYTPTKQLCSTRAELLEAMSGGGRVGFDAPYQTRGCDMRWFTPDEICAILSRFSHIHVIGDSMMRHLIQAMNVFIRRDLDLGARATWRTGLLEGGIDCRCRTIFHHHPCADEGMVPSNTKDIWRQDPTSIKCSADMAEIDYVLALNDFSKPEVMKDFAKKTSEDGLATRPTAYIMGAGAWFAFEHDKTQRLVATFERAMANPTGSFESFVPDANNSAPDPLPTMPRLFISPNAQGLHKEQMFIQDQNNVKLVRFEREMGAWLQPRGWDHLGLFNLTIQSVSIDGSHATMESNLMKAMMVFNWLDSLA